MVIELIASRILAPYVGVSLYTWTSIIGVILTGIALGNFIGGKIADRRPSPVLLAAVFLIGALLTVCILPAVKLVASANLFGTLPEMLDITLKTSVIFFLPAIVLSMVSPMVIKLTLADLGQTGGVVGTIYAVSTAGAILGTFMTGFFFILWFGTKMIIWLVAGVLLLTGIITWSSWSVPGRWKLTLKNIFMWLAALEIVLVSIFIIQANKIDSGQAIVRESNYFTIQASLVSVGDDNVIMLRLDQLIHSFTKPGDPMALIYESTQVFRDISDYILVVNHSPRILHLGGGGYTFPRYMEISYRESIKDVVEIDPAVTETAYDVLGLPRTTSITTYNQDARRFLIQRKTGDKYDIVIGDVFNDRSTPFHLTTREFDRLVKANMASDGVYMINIVDDIQRGRYLPSFLTTLKQVFKNVYLFSTSGDIETQGVNTFVLAATDRDIDTEAYKRSATRDGEKELVGFPYSDTDLATYLANKKPVILTDDHAPTDIMVAPLVDRH
jgi:spermidine synthase